ncbi:Uncharacterised protein [uncultured archaeon]|nr:Uncharacterised protein [uncultured archaeon]
MHPKIHLIIGIIFVIILHIFFSQITLAELSIIFLSSFLIDGDHYLYYFIREKNINPFKCYNWYKEHLKKTLTLSMAERKKEYTGFYLFHGIEPLTAIFLLGTYVFPFLIFVFIGLSLHMIVDVPHEYYIKRTIQKSSLIYNYTQWKKLFRK